MVQNAAEENPVVGLFTNDPSRELGDFIGKGSSAFAIGVGRCGALGEGHSLLVVIHASDIVAVAGELEGDVTHSRADVKDLAGPRSHIRLHEPSKLRVREPDEVWVPPKAVAEAGPGSQAAQIGSEPARVRVHVLSIPIDAAASESEKSASGLSYVHVWDLLVEPFHVHGHVISYAEVRSWVTVLQTARLANQSLRTRLTASSLDMEPLLTQNRHTPDENWSSRLVPHDLIAISASMRRLGSPSGRDSVNAVSRIVAKYPGCRELHAGRLPVRLPGSDHNPTEGDANVQDCILPSAGIHLPIMGIAGFGIQANATKTVRAHFLLPGVKKHVAEAWVGRSLSCVGLDWHGDPPI
jgi:hypothetical protein